MIQPAQLKLLERARQAKGHSQEELSSMLRVWAGVERIEDLTKESFGRVMDHYTWIGFRDRSRPILSTRTQALIARIQYQLSMSNFTYETVLRSYGNVSDLRDLSGIGLLRVLYGFERQGFDVNIFVAMRRDITPKQLKLLQIARNQTGMTDDKYSRDLQEFGGVNKARDLDSRGFDLMMVGMEVAGFERSAPAKPAPIGFGRRPGFASPEQVEMIRALWREWIGPRADSAEALEADLNAWLERYHRVSSLRFLTTGGAGKVITALKAMKMRDAATREAAR